MGTAGHVLSVVHATSQSLVRATLTPDILQETRSLRHARLGESGDMNTFHKMPGKHFLKLIQTSAL